MARTNSYGYYASSTNKYGWASIHPGEGPYYGGKMGGDPSVTEWHLYGLNYPPPVPGDFTIEYYPTTSDSTPLFMWTSTSLDTDTLQYQIQINYLTNDFSSPTHDLGSFSATAMATPTWKSYITLIAEKLTTEGRYYARIRSTDGLTWSAWASTIEFQYILDTPPIPTIDSDIVTPTTSYEQTVCGNKAPGVRIFVRNNNGDWAEATYGLGQAGNRWCYDFTFTCGYNYIDVISSWDGETDVGVSTQAHADVYLVCGSIETYNVWNCFDELGMLVSLDRLPAEKNKAYKKRILDVFKNPGNSTETGLTNAIARELGIDKSDVTVQRLSDLSDTTYSDNLLNSDGNAIGTDLERYALEVYSHNPIFWGTVIADESVWDAIDEEYSGVSYLPHLWDPSVSGIYNKWQKTGIGDQDDLWVSNVVKALDASGLFPNVVTGSGMMAASGSVKIDMNWRLPVHSGYFYTVVPSGASYWS